MREIIKKFDVTECELCSLYEADNKHTTACHLSIISYPVTSTFWLSYCLLPAC